MMKQNKLITLIVLTITVICSSLPLQGQTKLYNQYKHRTDMVVMCVMDYPITDSLKTDITMFMPKTKEDLWPMVQEFGLGLDKDTVYNRFEKETTLVDDGVLDSFDIVSIVSELTMEYDIDISIDDMTAENFNSAAAMHEMILRIQDEY